MSPRQRYDAAMAAGDLNAAEDALRDCLRSGADAGLAVVLAGLVRARGDLEEAEAILARAAEISPNTEILENLAVLQFKRRDFSASETTFERIIAVTPDADLRTYRSLAKVKGILRGEEAVREVMRRAVAAHPSRLDVLTAYADTLPPAEGIAVLEAGCAKADAAAQAFLRLRITGYRAPEIRRAMGLPRHGISWQDTTQWPDPAALPALKDALEAQIASGVGLASALLMRAYTAVADGDWEAAADSLARVRGGPKRTAGDFMALGAAFHASLDAMSDAEITGDLAPVERIIRGDDRPEPKLFIAGDPKYIVNFTVPFLHQLDEFPPVNVHVHVLDGPGAAWGGLAETLGGLKRVRATLSAEESGAGAADSLEGRVYYHAVRYIRLFQELQRAAAPIWLVDADTTALRDPGPLMNSLTRFDLALRTYPAQFEPILKIAGACVGVAPTPGGTEFARRVAAYIAYWKKRKTWGWGIDQFALFSAYAHMSAQRRPPTTLFLDDEAISGATDDRGVFRLVSGVQKYLDAARGTKD